MRALLLLLVLAAPLAAQQPDSVAPTQPTRPLNLQPALKPPVADTGIFSPVPLPEANRVRAPNGAPGPAYWQQRADYTIRATLDTATRRLSGTEQIRYTNNSPDTLRFVWMQLDQNLFRPGSIGSLLFAAESRFGGAGFEGGFEIASLTQTSSPAPTGTRKRSARPSAPVALRHRVDDTMMYVDLATPIPPGGTTTFDLAYAFNVPEHGADRMGRDGSLYELAQWYPRMAVYDDVHGWNTDKYLGQGEFYLEYGDFDYAVTVPAGYIVAGSGTLQNPAEVLTAAQRSRLAAAVKSDTTIAIESFSSVSPIAAR